MGHSTKDSVREHVAIINIEKINCKEQLNEQSLHLENFFQVLSGIDIRGVKKQRESLINKTKPHEIRGLYDFRKHRAVQEILFGPIIFCNIDKNVIEEHYKSLLGNDKGCNISDLPKKLWPNSVPKKTQNVNLTKSITAKEVSTKLISKISNDFSNTRTPGLDRITYQHLLKHDKDCSILTAFFNACLKLQTIPDNWKQTYSVLIKNNKDVDESDIRNWHSVTLINTIPKLFQIIIASRLSLWAKNTNRLSLTQKGFLLNDAACESSFILQECRSFAQKNKKDLAVAWLDFSSASALLPQEAVFYALEQHSVPQFMINLIKSMLISAETRLRVSDNARYTKSMKISKGLPQGAPINSILINLVMEPILRSLSSEKSMFEIFDQKLNHLVIPNELTLIADSQTALQDLLNLVEKQAKLIGLQFDLNKCFTFYYNHMKNNVEENTFVFFSHKLQNLPKNKRTEFFGVKQGLSIGQNGAPTIKELTESIEEIDKSHLDNFQKLDAILSFLMPRVESCLKGLQICDKTFIEEVDEFLKSKIISWLSLSDDATCESIVFQVECQKKLSNRKGKENKLKNVLPFLDLFYVMQILQAFRMLTSDDIIVKNIAFQSLKAEVNELILKKKSNKITDQDLGNFLTANVSIKEKNNSSFWKRIREGTLYLRKKINLVWNISDNKIQLEIKKKRNKATVLNTNCEEKLKKALVQFYINKIEMKNPEDVKKLEDIRPKRTCCNGRKRLTKKVQKSKAPIINKTQVPPLLSTNFPVLL